MQTKTRIITVVLAGILIGTLAVKIRQFSAPLSGRLVSTDDATRAAALKIYSVKNEEAREKIVDEITTLLISPSDPRQHQFALYALRKSGFTSPRIIKPMIDALGSADAKVREEAKAGLLEMGDAAVPAGLQSLSQFFKGREDLIAILANASPKAVPAMTAAVSEPNNLVKRRAVARIFGFMKPGETLAAARAAAPALAQACKSTDPMLSLNAAFSLQVIDPGNLASAPVFLRSVQKPNWDTWEVRGWESAEALTGIPGAVAQSVAVLTRVMSGAQDGFIPGRQYKRPFIADVLEKLAPRSTKVSDLEWDLKNKNPAIRYRAALIIGKTPKPYGVLVRPLIDTLADRDDHVAARGAWALIKIGLLPTKAFASIAYPRYVALVGRLMGGPIEAFAEMASPAFGGLNESALPAVVDALKTGEIRLEAANLLVRTSSNVSFLTALLRHSSNGEVRLMAAIALARLAPNTLGLTRELEKGTKRLGAVGVAVNAALASLKGSGSQK